MLLNEFMIAIVSILYKIYYIDILSNLLKATGGFSFQGANNSSQSYQNTMERNITLIIRSTNRSLW